MNLSWYFTWHVMVTPGPAAPASLGRSRADFQPGKLVLSSPFLSIDVPWHAQTATSGRTFELPGIWRRVTASQVPWDAVRTHVSSLQFPRNTLDVFGCTISASLFMRSIYSSMRCIPCHAPRNSRNRFFQAMAAVLFGNLFPRWLLRSLVTHRWNNAEMLPTAAAAGWEATAVRRIPPNWRDL